MLIRKDQMTHLAQAAHTDFVNRMLQHTRTLYPEFYYRMDGAGCRAFIEATIQKASAYNLDEEYAVTRFLDYRILLGEEFEGDAEYIWMGRILADPDRDQSEKIADIDRIQFGYGAVI